MRRTSTPAANSSSSKTAESGLEPLAEHMGRSEPEIPSIRYPLAHEAQIRDDEARELAAADSPAQKLPRTRGVDESADPWGEAMIALARYRAGSAAHALASAPADTEPRTGFFEQRYERREAAAAVLDALARLDPAIRHDRETQERVLEEIGLGRASHSQDRSPGFEL